jgi:hypothetical protein
VAPSFPELRLRQGVAVSAKHHLRNSYQLLVQDYFQKRAL